MENNVVEEPKKKFSFFKKIGILLILILMITFGYARFWIHKFITIQEYPITVETLPSTFNGLKIVQFSDIHFGRTTNEAEVEKMVSEINRTNPDIVIFSGDLFDSSINLTDKNIDFLKSALSKIQAKQKKYAIKGDSDYLNIEAFEQIMSETNFKILDGQNELFFNGSNTPIQIAGIPSIQKEEINLENTFKTDVNNVAYKILIAHEPTIIKELGNTKVDLILSGHSLGGLVSIPYLGEIFKKTYTDEFQKGYYKKDDTTMYVSSGIGTEELSFRLFNQPSINLYRFYNYN